MKTEQEIRARIAEIESDDRLHYKVATVFENAPLAMIQLEGESVTQALRWVLGESTGCAWSYRTAPPLGKVK